LSDEWKKETYRDVRFFHGALQLVMICKPLKRSEHFLAVSVNQMAVCAA